MTATIIHLPPLRPELETHLIPVLAGVEALYEMACARRDENLIYLASAVLRDARALGRAYYGDEGEPDNAA
jgi:hypothetical protein